MPNYRRNYVPGGTYFFTVVTHERRPILTTDLGRRCLRRAITTAQRRRPFELVAVVLLPDHFHAIWALPPGDSKYPHRWKRIKEAFTTRSWPAAESKGLDPIPGRNKESAGCGGGGSGSTRSGTRTT